MYPLNGVFPEISFPGTEPRRAKHWSRSLGTRSKISIMRWGNFDIGGLAFVCCHRRQHSTGMDRTWGMMKWWSLDQTERLVNIRDFKPSSPGRNPTGRMTFHLPSAAKRGRSHRHPSCQPSIRPNLVPTDINPNPFTVPPHRRAAILPPPSRIQNQKKYLGPAAMQRTQVSEHTVKTLLHQSPNPSLVSPLPCPSPNSGSFPKRYPASCAQQARRK
jgi:hypothetical protein